MIILKINNVMDKNIKILKLENNTEIEFLLIPPGKCSIGCPTIEETGRDKYGYSLGFLIFVFFVIVFAIFKILLNFKKFKKFCFFYF